MELHLYLLDFFLMFYDIFINHSEFCLENVK